MTASDVPTGAFGGGKAAAGPIGRPIGAVAAASGASPRPEGPIGAAAVGDTAELVAGIAGAWITGAWVTGVWVTGAWVAGVELPVSGACCGSAADVGAGAGADDGPGAATADGDVTAASGAAGAAAGGPTGAMDGFAEGAPRRRPIRSSTARRSASVCARFRISRTVVSWAKAVVPAASRTAAVTRSVLTCIGCVLAEGEYLSSLTLADPACNKRRDHCGIW